MINLSIARARSALPAVQSQLSDFLFYLLCNHRSWFNIRTSMDSESEKIATGLEAIAIRLHRVTLPSQCD